MHLFKTIIITVVNIINTLCKKNCKLMATDGDVIIITVCVKKKKKYNN